MAARFIASILKSPIRRLSVLVFSLAIAAASPVFAQDATAPNGPTGPAPQATAPAPQPAPASQPADSTAPATSTPAPASEVPELMRRPVPTSPAAKEAAEAADAKAPKVVVPSGTHIPLVLHNGISTRSARAGDPVYFETLFPIMVNGRVAIPAGSYVSGEITDSQRAGRVKGRAQLMVKLNVLILPNAYQVDLNAIPSGGSTGGNETVDSEGRVVGDSDKASDVGTVIKTTTLGAGIGGIATRSGAGAGIGAGAGLAAGLVTVLLTRGPDAELPRGTTLEAVLNHAVLLDADKDQFAGPGQASALAGPSNREPVRSKIPF
ncbi:MAG: hypothetical protein WBZ32_09295 [Candidatus Acidiferrales bacterium]